MEQNARLNRAYTNTVADTTNVTSKKQPNANTSNPSTNTTPKKSFNKDKPPSTEHVLPAMKEKRLSENRCVKCGKTNYGSLVCRTGWKASTPLPYQKPSELAPAKRQYTDSVYTKNHNAKPPFQKKPDLSKKTDPDIGMVKITELGSDSEDNNNPATDHENQSEND